MTPMTLPRALAIAAVALLVGVGIDLLVDLPTGRSVLLGLGGCIALIAGPKWLGKVWLQRPEGYYEQERARRAAAATPDEAGSASAEGEAGHA